MTSKWINSTKTCREYWSVLYYYWA